MCAAVISLSCAGELYKEFQPSKTSRTRENIEWSISYTYNAQDVENPRLLLIGDSICNGYQQSVRKELEKEINVTFWATSKCVTAGNYFRELEFILDENPYDLITFNNGLHSLKTDRKEYETAFRAAVKFIRKKCPNAKLLLVITTPSANEKLTAQVKELNQIVVQIAKEEGLQILDLFALMDPFDRKEYWSDDYHFRPAAIKRQAEFIAETARKELKPSGKVVQKGTATGPKGALK